MIDQHIKDEIERIVRTRKEILECAKHSKKLMLQNELKACYESLVDVCIELICSEDRQNYIDDTTGKNTGGW